MNWDPRQIAELVSIVGVVNGATIWALKRLLDSQREHLTAQITHLIQRNDGQDDDLANLRVHVAQNYIHRDDAIKYFGRFEQKIDAVWSHLISNAKQSSDNGS